MVHSGAPEFIRSDNGPVIAARDAANGWLKRAQIRA
jgi:hypothetical protein